MRHGLGSPPPLADRLRRALTTPIVGITDDLLALCPPSGLRVVWAGPRCAVAPLHGWTPLADETLSRSIGRAVLARVATICNASPYAGRGTLTISGRTPRRVSVSYINTAAEQRLWIAPVRRALSVPLDT